MTAQVSDTVAGYARLLPDLTHKVKVVTPATSSREELVGVWKQWMQEAGKPTMHLTTVLILLHLSNARDARLIVCAGQ